VQFVWGQSNHRLPSRLFRTSDGTSVEQAMPYSMTEMGPPALPQLWPGDVFDVGGRDADE
jgi:hypothetical protein